MLEGSFRTLDLESNLVLGHIGWIGSPSRLCCCLSRIQGVLSLRNPNLQNINFCLADIQFVSLGVGGFVGFLSSPNRRLHFEVVCVLVR